MKNIHSIWRVFLPAAFLLIFVSGKAAASGLEQQTRAAVITIDIYGQIKNSGVDLNGVTVRLSGSANETTTTGGSGFYGFFNLSPSGTYTITPSHPLYTFTPPSRTFTNLSGDLSNINFTAVENCSHPAPNCRTNGKIAFVRSGDIYISNQAGTDLVNLTNHPAEDNEPVFSPDGNKIAFVSNRDGNSEIYAINIDGSNLTRLTTNAAMDINPSFSPDGTKILFASNRNTMSRQIYIMYADGSEPVRLTNDDAFKAFPSFAPDGSKIVFSKLITFQNMGVFTMNPDGSNQTQLTTPMTGTDQYPTFSPDGSLIMFNRFDFGSFQSPIHQMNPDGSNLFTVLTASNRLYKPSFAPNGLRILYAVLADAGPTRYDVVTKSLLDGDEKFLIINGTNPAWQPVRQTNTRTPFDFDGDRFADISVFRPTDGTWYLLKSRDGFGAIQFGANGDVIVPGDYDADGKTDTAVFRRGDDSTWYILRSADNSFQAIQWGARNIEQPLLFDTPVPADYDGDGKTDVAVWRLTDNLSEPARFLIRQSTSGAARIQQWGMMSDRPVPADFDGDGRADLAVYRGGTWYILNSIDNSARISQFGLASDKTVAADYDGDGKADLAVYRPSGGFWYFINSSNNSFTGAQFGIAEDKPSPADFDGDGKADLAVFRPSNGTWYLLRSLTGFTGLQFGTGGDVPTPNAFVR